MTAFEVEFLPVGEQSRAGDAITIRYGADDAFDLIVIDGGTIASGEATVEHLERLCRHKPIVSHLVVTHPDLDHSSGARTILERVDVRHVWTHVPWLHASAVLPHLQDARWTADGLAARLKRNYDVIDQIVSRAEALGIPVSEPFAGAAIGPFTVLSPPRHVYPKLVAQFPDTPSAASDTTLVGGALAKAMNAFAAAARYISESWYEERLRDGGNTGARNDSSAVLLGRFAGHKPILLTGDAGNDGLTWAAAHAEASGIPLRDFSLVQIPHHGSRRNVGPTILNRLIGPLQPIGSNSRFTAVVSAPKDDADHPRKIVLNAFMRRGAHVLATQGVAIALNYGFSARPGYGPATPKTFSNVVESYDD